MHFFILHGKELMLWNGTIWKCNWKNINLCIDAMRFASSLQVDKFILSGSTSKYLYYGKPINENAIPSPTKCIWKC